MDGRGFLEVLLVTLPQCPCCFSYIFFTAGEVITLVAVYYPTSTILGFLVLRSHKCVLDCGAAFEVGLYAILTTYVFEAF